MLKMPKNSRTAQRQAVRLISGFRYVALKCRKSSSISIELIIHLSVTHEGHLAAAVKGDGVVIDLTILEGDVGAFEFRHPSVGTV